MSKVRVCFLGTPEFAVVALKALLSDEHFEVVGVVTQPDRPAGRKMVLTPSPVKEFATSQGLRVISPASVNRDGMPEEVESWRADVAVVVAFGQIVSTKFLGLFPLGCVNIHGSLLPKWRGAAPIQRSVEAGDAETGVALQKMVKELDAGDVLGVRKIAIDPNMTAMELHDQLALLGTELLHVELMDYVRGNLSPVPQDPALVTFAKKLDKAESQLDWGLPAVQIHNKIRAFTMGPGTYTHFQGKKLKIHRTLVSKSLSGQPGQPFCLPVPPGRLKVSEGKFFVGTGDGALELLELQPESRNRMTATEFLKGHTLNEGDYFGQGQDDR